MNCKAERAQREEECKKRFEELLGRAEHIDFDKRYTVSNVQFKNVSELLKNIPGTLRMFVDTFGRRVLIIGLTEGMCVIYERYITEFILYSHTTSEIRKKYGISDIDLVSCHSNSKTPVFLDFLSTAGL